MHPQRPEPESSVADGSTASRRRFLAAFTAAIGAVFVSGSPAGAATTKTTKKKPPRKKTTAKATIAAATVPVNTSGAAAFPSTDEVVIAFTYTPASSGGRIHNPYIAVWVEDLNGVSQRTLQLSYQPGKGLRWLPDLRRWYQADQVRQIAGGVDLLSTVSSATRLPGAYALAWNGLDDTGTPVAAGDYVLCVEAAREKGPYSLAKEKITVGPTMAPVKFADTGELSAITVALKPKK